MITHVKEFEKWLSCILKENNLNHKLKSNFYFLPYSEYNKEKLADRFVIYEDWWISNPKIIKSKILSVLKLSKRVYGRECKVQNIDKPTSDKFIIENHLHGTTNSKIKFGLFNKDNLIAVATFAGQRQFKEGRSVELLRFSNKIGYIVIGGLDKLLQAYIKKYNPNTLMTYIDLDWGSGESFLNLGFETVKIKPPMEYYVNKKTGIRIQKKNLDEFESKNQFIKVKNQGSKKMVKTIK